jgi:hypothetical protein
VGRVRIDVLAPAERAVVRLESLNWNKGDIVVAWFTDDAGFRWQVDELQHLVDTHGDEYKA